MRTVNLYQIRQQSTAPNSGDIRFEIGFVDIVFDYIVRADRIPSNLGRKNHHRSRELIEQADPRSGNTADVRDDGHSLWKIVRDSVRT